MSKKKDRGPCGTTLPSGHVTLEQRRNVVEIRL